MAPQGVCVLLLACLCWCGVSAGKNTRQSDALTTLVARQTQQLESVISENTKLRSDLQAAQGAINVLQTQMNALTDNVRSQLAAMAASGTGGASGVSTYVRWGKSACPQNAQILYTGVAAGGYAHDTGSAANRVCLTLEPVFENITLDQSAEIDGVEYILPNMHNEDALCAVCQTPHSTTFMVPGTNKCPGVATPQYRGFLSAGYHGDESASEYLCLDAEPEKRVGGAGNQNSGYFEHVLAHCGSLPCPPYAEQQAITCVVCSL